MAWSSKYTIELWDKNGIQLADFSGRATNRKIVLSRNRPDEISFQLDLNEFEKYCADQHVDPKQILIEGSTEVRIKRLGTYIAGGQLVYCEPAISANEMIVDCRVMGFLWLFNKRFTGETNAGLVSEVYTAAEGSALSRTDLLWSLIDQSQSLTNGDFGITRGVAGGSATLYDKTYSRTKLYDAFIAMTEVQTDPIDIEITYDKVANTYEQIGSDRPDIVFEFPGNIKQLNAPRDATDLSNEVIGLGSGGSDGTQVVDVQEDLVSQSNYQLRQEPLQTNGTDNSDNGITDAALARLDAKGAPLAIPRLTVNANVPPYVTDYRIGDRVTVKVNDHPMVSNINGTYRIEKLTLDISDNDDEQVTPEVAVWE